MFMTFNNCDSGQLTKVIERSERESEKKTHTHKHARTYTFILSHYFCILIVAVVWWFEQHQSIIRFSFWLVVQKQSAMYTTITKRLQHRSTNLKSQQTQYISYSRTRRAICSHQRSILRKHTLNG